MKHFPIFHLLMSLLAVAMAGRVTAVAGDLLVGFSQVDITPPVGAIITGPGGHASTGTDDPLMARAMVAQRGDRKLVIIGVDLVKIRRDLADQSIALVTQQTDISRDAVMICPSHNHSSPLIPAQGDNATANKAYIDTLPGLISTCVIQANKAAREDVHRPLAGL